MASVAQTIYDALIYAGATPIEAAAIMGNMVQESSLDPETQVMDSNGAMSRGLVMWNDKGAGAGVNWSQYITGNVTQDIVQQVLLLKSQGAFQDASGSTVEEAAMNFVNNFERPDPAYANYANRVNSAVTISQAATSNNWSGLAFGNESTADLPPGMAQAAAAAPAGGSSGVGPGLQAIDTSGQAIPNPPGMNDIPGLIDYIKQYFGADAWLLNIPSVATVLEQAVAQGRGSDTAYIQALIANTSWFQTTSQAVQQYEQEKANNPANYNFNVAGSLAAQTLANVRAAAATQGVTIDDTTAQALAQNYLEFGWDSQQLNAALGDLVYVSGQPGTKGYATNAGGIIQQLQAAAGQYLQNPNDPTLQSWAQNIAAGTQTMQQFDAYMKQNASLKWTGMAPQIAQGYTPQQIVSTLQNNAAQTMEVDPSQINFITDPTYSKILDYVPPDSKNGVHRIMTQNEMDQYLKGLPQWANTLQARQQVSTVADQIATTFGKLGG